MRTAPKIDSMSTLEQVQSDATAALKAGDRERAGALRLIVSPGPASSLATSLGSSSWVRATRR